LSRSCWRVHRPSLLGGELQGRWAGLPGARADQAAGPLAFGDALQRRPCRTFLPGPRVDVRLPPRASTRANLRGLMAGPRELPRCLAVTVEGEPIRPGRPWLRRRPHGRKSYRAFLYQPNVLRHPATLAVDPWPKRSDLDVGFQLTKVAEPGHHRRHCCVVPERSRSPCFAGPAARLPPWTAEDRTGHGSGRCPTP